MRKMHIEWATSVLDMPHFSLYFIQIIYAKGKTEPESVDEHLVAGRTLNTLCGEQYTTKTSSVVNESDGWSRISFSSELEITILVGAPGLLSGPSGKATWNENGTGSSSSFG